MTVKTLRVILDREGDLDAEKALVPFALNQRFILNNLMNFQGLMQDRRVVRMIDGSVITVRSFFGEDSVFISCPVEVVEVVEEEVVVETSTAVLFFVMNKVDDLYRVERYKVETFETVGDTVAVFESVVTLKDVGINYDDRTYVLAGSGDTNSIVVQCKAMYVRGVLYPFAEPIDGFSDWWPGAQLRIPVEQFNTTDYETYEMGNSNEFPTDYSMGPGGNLFYRGYTYYDGFNTSNNIGARHLMRATGEDLAIYEHITSGGHAYPPVVGTTYATSSCVCDDKLLIALENKSSPYSGWYIGEWIASASGLNFWDSGSTPFLSTMTRHFLDLSEYDFYRVCQILFKDGTVYIFYDSGVFTPQANLEIKSYDATTAALVTSIDFGVNGGDFTRASIVNYQLTSYICVATIDSDGTGETSSIYLLDMTTLATVFSVSGVPMEYAGDNFVALNTPTTDTMLDHHNRLRREWNDIYGALPLSRIFYLGKSAVCRAIAQEHLTWLLANGRVQHEDVNGDTVGVRALAHGVLSAGENLFTMWPSLGTTEDIEYVCDDVTGWPSSPGHYANIIGREYSQFGWISGTYSAAFTEIIAGPGQYVNGSYTTSETVIQVPPEYRGRIKLLVAVFA